MRCPTLWVRRMRRSPIPIAVALAVLAAAPVPAPARGGGGDREEVRVSGTCGRGATSKLRLRARDGAIRVTFEVDHTRAGRPWRVALVQDRRVVWRGTARTRAPRGSLEVERTLRDLPGADRVSARAWGPGGVTCYAAAGLAG